MWYVYDLLHRAVDLKFPFSRNLLGTIADKIEKFLFWILGPCLKGEIIPGPRLDFFLQKKIQNLNLAVTSLKIIFE